MHQVSLVWFVLLLLLKYDDYLFFNLDSFWKYEYKEV